MSESTGQAGIQTDQRDRAPADRDFTIELLQGETLDGTECWDATTATTSSTAAGTSQTPTEALRRLAVVRSRRRREWDGDAWVDYVPESSVSVRDSSHQFTIEVRAFAELDEHGRRWSAVSDGRDVETGRCGRTVGEALRLLASTFERTARNRPPESLERPALPEHQVETLLESSRSTRFREAVTTRVAACFDREGHQTGLPKLFIDGEAVGTDQDIPWPDEGIELSVDRPGIVYDDLRRQFETHVASEASNE
jgi:hypothetical protein